MSQVIIRTAAPEEGAAVRHVVREAFGEEGDRIGRILDDLESGDLLRASRVAEVDGAVVGHVGLSQAWLDTRNGPVDTWLLSPLSTLPERQGQGIGGALIGDALAVARASGVPLVFLEGSPEVYGRHGFETARDRGFRPPSTRIPVAAFQVAVLPGWDGVAGTLVYPDVWWRHGAVGLTDPLLGELEEKFGAW